MSRPQLKLLLLLLCITRSAISFGQCNGHAELCGKRFNEVAYLTTHNAFNAEEDNFNLPNQTYGLTRQLNDGVRALMLDVYDEGGVVTVYHSLSFLGTATLESNLTEIKDFLDENSNEVVSIIFECYINSDMMDSAFTNVGLKPYLLEQDLNTDWPTLQQMITTNKRLVVLSDCDDATAGQEWYHYVWDFAVETPFSNNSLADFDCEFNRGDEENDLFILNHFATDPTLGTGRTDLSEQANEFNFFFDRAVGCMTELGKFPNFPTVDFYELGDALQVVDSLNLSSLQTGITEIDKTNSVTAFPNPSKGLFQLNWKKQMNTAVRVFDSTGKLMKELQVTETSLQLDLDGLAEDVYHAVIQTETSTETVKLIHLR